MAGFDTTPKPAFLLAMQNQRWTVSGALAELVDNGFGSGRGNADIVEIIHDIKTRTISVLDNGRGMEAVGRLFQLGNTIGRAPGDIGMYGSGGTMAILWLAHNVEVWTLSEEGMVSFDIVDWAEEMRAERFPVVSDRWHRSTAANTPAELRAHRHGTLIKLHLMRERSVTASNVKRDLAKLYAPGLRMGKQLLWTSPGLRHGGTDALEDPLLLPDDDEHLVHIDLTVDLGNGDVLPITGMIGVIEDLPQSQSVVTVGYGSRVITTTRDCYSRSDGTERYSGVGVAGWLDLGEGWQPYLATTKDVMNDRPAWDMLMDYIFQMIRPLLQMVDEDKLYLELQDIAFMLEARLAGMAQIDVPAAARPERPEPTGRTRGPKEETDESEREPKLPGLDEDGDRADRNTPAATRIKLTPLDDASMEGLLMKAAASREGEAIDVFINKDHQLIKTAMIQKPVNREVLNLGVATAISGVIADDEAIMAKIFRRSGVLRQLEAREGRQREGLILRMLVDRTKRAA
jgi:hypothetical protein